MANCYCKYCGQIASNIQILTSGHCPKNPEGKKHALYEGAEKTQYVCKFCGQKSSSIQILTSGYCPKNPDWKKHSPAL